MQALILYTSRKGTTRKLAFQIEEFVRSFGIQTLVVSGEDQDLQKYNHVDYYFLGCWTRGRFLMFQKPVKEWINAVKKLEVPIRGNVIFFTTYNIRTGSMFLNMRKFAGIDSKENCPCIKSRKGLLTQADKITISDMIHR